MLLVILMAGCTSAPQLPPTTISVGCVKAPLDESHDVASVAAPKEFNLLADADDNGRQPNTAQFFAAEAKRKLLACDAASSSTPQSSPKGTQTPIQTTAAGATKPNDVERVEAPKDFNLLFDADDNGRQPSTAQILAAEATRKLLTLDVASSSAPQSSPKGTQTPIQTTAAGVTSTAWTPIGPGNVGGRIRSVLIDPRNANRILVGSVTGGIWLSTDGAQTFVPLIDSFSNIAVSTMAFAPSNPDIVYAGTGESYQGFPGIGLYKSTDAGVTWPFLSSTAVTNTNSIWQYINRIVVSPADANLVLAATWDGLFRTADGGTTWTRVLQGVQSSSVAMNEVAFDPNNGSNAVASGVDGFIYYSSDTGATWLPSNVLLAATSINSANSARAVLAYAKSVSGLVLCSFDNNSGEIWASTDGGKTWVLQSNPKHLHAQGHYANTIWVDPTNNLNVVFGGLDLYRSADAGVTFTKISTWQDAEPGLPQPHADHHVIVSSPNFSSTTPIVYFGNDGGLYRSTNIFTASADSATPSSWVNLNNGLAVTQFYSGAGKSAAGGKYVGGTQDNGTLLRSGITSWVPFFGGDGGFVAVDPVSDSTAYGEYVYASIFRTDGITAQGSGASTTICNGILEGKKDASGGPNYCGPNATEEALFIAPFILDPNSRDRMLVGAKSLWVTGNVRDTAPAWASIKAPVASGATAKHYISAIAAHAGDGNNIWVGYSVSGQIWRTSNGLATTPTWTLVNAGNMPTSSVNRITIDQANRNHVWAAFSGFSTNRLWETTDGGSTWNSISNNLPLVTIHDIKRHPTQSKWLYAAAANGVYSSEDGGVTWGTTNDGPSGVRVKELFWYDNSTLVAATFGRGMFAAPVTSPLPPLPPLSKRGGIDFDGSGKSQLVVRSSAGQMQAGRLNSINNTFTFSAIPDPGPTYKVIATGDLDGNGKSDLVFQTLATDSSGRVTVNAWIDFLPSSPITLRPVNPAWVAQVSADLDGDGFGDLTFRFTGDDGMPNDTGVSYNWFQKAGGAYDTVRKRGGAPLNWTLLGAADLNGDGAADMVYISPTGVIKALMATLSRTCANLTVSITLPAGFSALKLADFTGNQRGDILIRDSTGATQLISLNGNGLDLPPYTAKPDDINASCTASALTVAGSIINLPTSDPTWTYYASGDFNGDGIFDIVWKQPNGTLTVWLMNANGAPTVINNAGTAPVGYTPIPLQ